MQIVIDISEEAYEDIKDKKRFFRQVEIDDFEGYPYFGAILNGVVLPKGHGRLVDADKIESTLHNKAFDLAGSKRFFEINWAHKMVCDAPTIIEADKEVENDD